MNDKMAELEKAKEATRWLLDHPNGSVDFHGLTYYAGRVEALRAEILAAM